MIGFILIFWSSKTWRSDRALPIATSVLIVIAISLVLFLSHLFEKG